jgi:hypothetical protein
VSVHYPCDIGEQERAYFDVPPEEWACGECGASFEPHEAVVYRCGPDTEWFLHGQCARQLGTTLIADSREAELGERPGWTPRAAAILRHRLTVEEAA